MFSSKNKVPKECDHLFYPHYDDSVDKRYPVGQKCALCDHFNSNEDLGITFDLKEFKRQHK